MQTFALYPSIFTINMIDLAILKTKLNNLVLSYDGLCLEDHIKLQEDLAKDLI